MTPLDGPEATESDETAPDILIRAKAWQRSFERPGAPHWRYAAAAAELIPELIAEIESLRSGVA